MAPQSLQVSRESRRSTASASVTSIKIAFSLSLATTRKGFGLGQGARIAVHDVTAVQVAAAQAPAHQLDHQLVGDQAAGFHEVLGLAAVGAALLDRAAQDVAGGNLGIVEITLDEITHGPLAGTGRAEQDQTLHPRRPRMRPLREKES